MVTARQNSAGSTGAGAGAGAAPHGMNFAAVQSLQFQPMAPSFHSTTGQPGMSSAQVEPHTPSPDSLHLFTSYHRMQEAVVDIDRYRHFVIACPYKPASSVPETTGSYPN